MRKNRREEKEHLYQELRKHYAKRRRTRIIRDLILVFLAFMVIFLLTF